MTVPKQSLREQLTPHVDQGRATDMLQSELRDLLCLAVVGDHVRWVLVDDEAGELTEWLSDATARWRTLADRVAKHLVRMGAAPDGRVRSLVRDIPLNWVPDGSLGPDEARRLLTHRLHVAAGRARQRRSETVDRDIGKLLDAVCTGLDFLP